MVPRPAATLMVLRDSPSGPEVMMLRRTERSEFVPGVLLFPGGALEESELDLCARLPAGHLGYRLAAMRETLEEAGVLVAVHPPPDPETLRDLREATRARPSRFVEILGERGLQPQPERLVFVSRWVTPPGKPRRYDTRFYACEAPAHAVPEPDGVEVTQFCWLRPDEILARAARGEANLMLPTMANLRVLVGHATVASLIEHLRCGVDESARAVRR